MNFSEQEASSYMLAFVHRGLSFCRFNLLMPYSHHPSSFTPCGVWLLCTVPAGYFKCKLMVKITLNTYRKSQKVRWSVKIKNIILFSWFFFIYSMYIICNDRKTSTSSEIQIRIKASISTTLSASSTYLYCWTISNLENGLEVLKGDFLMCFLLRSFFVFFGLKTNSYFCYRNNSIF